MMSKELSISPETAKLAIEVHARRASPRVGPLGSDDDIRFLALSMAGEAGEAANVVKKAWRDGTSLNRAALAEEIAGTACYLIGLASALSLDLDQILCGQLHFALRKSSGWTAFGIARAAVGIVPALPRVLCRTAHMSHHNRLIPRKRRMKKIIVAPIVGWFLIAPDDDDIDAPQDVWHFAWLDAFSSKRRALKFATDNRWQKPYRAVRGRIAVKSEKR